jgi:hypothetical protein
MMPSLRVVSDSEVRLRPRPLHTGREPAANSLLHAASSLSVVYPRVDYLNRTNKCCLHYYVVSGVYTVHTVQTWTCSRACQDTCAGGVKERRGHSRIHKFPGCFSPQSSLCSDGMLVSNLD